MVDMGKIEALLPCSRKRWSPMGRGHDSMIGHLITVSTVAKSTSLLVSEMI